jgi:splicing factor 3A subunit 3
LNISYNLILKLFFLILKKIDYLKYLSQYDHLFAIPKDKKNQDYKRYLEGLYDYLYDFLQRVKPLLDLEGEIKNTENDFEQKWNEGTFPGWMVGFQIVVIILI